MKKFVNLSSSKSNERNFMKKPIIYSTALAAVLLAATTGAIINSNALATENSVELATETSSVFTTRPAIGTKNETIYALASADGATGSLFVGNHLYTGSETLPISMNIKYYLDDSEISASDLAGKSGHIKIVYTYNSETEINGKKVPFLAITGLTLDSAKFSNLELENGKVINENNSIVLVGFAMPGLSEDFGTDLLPNTFTLEADVTDFALNDSYTIFTNDFFKEIDTSKLSTIDELKNSMNQLSNGLGEIIAGSSDLSSGLESALAGSKELYNGAKELAAGISAASNGAATLSDGLTILTNNNAKLQAGATAIITSTTQELAASGINVTTETYSDVLTAAINNYTTQYIALAAHPEAAPAGALETLEATITKLEQAKSLLDFATGVIGYTEGAASAASGAVALKTGLATINAKTPDLVNGLGTLVSGNEKLYTGSVTLHDGLTTLKTSGIDKLVNFANNDLAAFTANARATVNAAKSYNHFSNDSAESVKFIIKTPSLK